MGMSEPMKLPDRPHLSGHAVKELYVIITRHSPDEEGIFSCTTPNLPMLLQFGMSEPEKIPAMVKIAKESPTEPGVTLHLCKFVLAEEMEQIK